MPSPQALLSNKVKLYAQKQDIDWEVNHLPPKTQIYLFINGQPYSEYAAPIGGTLGDDIFSDEFGTAKGQLSIPRNAEEKVLLGEIRLTFGDNPTDLGMSTFTADSTFYAMDIDETFNLDQGQTRSTRQPIPLSKISGSALKETDIYSNNITSVSERLELVAQTFKVDGSVYPQGLFVSSLDLFFASKDPVLPVSIELRPTKDGIPLSSEYINGSYVRKYPDDINLPSADIIRALAIPSVTAVATGTSGVGTTSTLARSLIAYLDTLEFQLSDVIEADGNPIVAYRYSQDTAGVVTAFDVSSGEAVNLNSVLVTATSTLPGYLIKRKNPVDTYTLTAQTDGTYLDPRNGSIYNSKYTVGVNFMVRNGVLYRFASAVPNTVEYRELENAQLQVQVNLIVTDFGRNLLAEAGIQRYITTENIVEEVVFDTRAIPATSNAPAVYAKTDRRWGTFMNAHAVWENNVYAGTFSRSYTADFPVSGTYTIEYAVDNTLNLYIDGDLIVTAGSNFGSSAKVTRQFSAGTHTIAWTANNSGDVGGLALKISVFINYLGTETITEQAGLLGAAGEFPSTNFQFSHPIYLKPGTYAICVRTNSDQYNLATSRVDLPLVGGSLLRKPESLAGSLFRATNLGKRVPDTNEDICFVLYKYRFDTGIRSLFLDNKAPDSEFKYDAFKLKYTSIEFPELGYIRPLVSHKSEAGIAGLAENITVERYVSLRERKVIDEAGDSSLELVMQSMTPDLSPILDKEKLVGLMIRNEVDPWEKDLSDQELTASEGVARARYLSKTVTLMPGFESNGMEVRVDVNRKVGTDIEVFVKVLAPSDTESFAKRPWKKMNLVSNDGTKEYVGYSDNSYVTEYYQLLTPDLEYTAGGLDNVSGLYKDFNRYIIKVVFYSNNPVYVPKIKNLFASACIDVPSAVISALGSGTQTGLRLADLSDVSDEPPTVGQALVWDGNQWKPSSGAAGNSLGDLVDVDASAVAGAAGQVLSHSLIWSPTDQIWKAVASSSGGSGGVADAQSLSQMMSFGRIGTEAFAPAKFSPCGNFIGLYPYTETERTTLAAIPTAASSAYNVVVDGTRYAKNRLRHIRGHGRNYVATMYTDLEVLKTGGNLYRQGVVGVELLSSVRYQFGTQRDGPYYGPPEGTYHTGLSDLQEYYLNIRQPVYLLETGGDGEAFATNTHYYNSSEDTYGDPSAEAKCTVYNFSDVPMEVYVNVRVWNFADETIGLNVIQYNRTAGGAGSSGYAASPLVTEDLTFTGTRGSEYVKTVTATIPAQTITDIRFAAGGKQTGTDDMAYLIDFYTSFKGWVVS